MATKAKGIVRKYVTRGVLSAAITPPAKALDTRAQLSSTRRRPSSRSKPSLPPVSSTSTS